MCWLKWPVIGVHDEVSVLHLVSYAEGEGSHLLGCSSPLAIGEPDAQRWNGSGREFVMLYILG